MEEQLVRFTIEHEQEEDGRWLAEVIELPGVLAYGRTPEDAMAKAQALGLRILADRIEEEVPGHSYSHCCRVVRADCSLVLVWKV